jgi:hypothetical protein
VDDEGWWPWTSRSGNRRRYASSAAKSTATWDSGEPSTPTTTGGCRTLFMATSFVLFMVIRDRIGG